MKESKRQWYIFNTEEIYKSYPGIRLTDGQLAVLIEKNYGGEITTHINNIRRSGCNNKKQHYVAKNL